MKRILVISKLIGVSLLLFLLIFQTSCQKPNEKIHVGLLFDQFATDRWKSDADMLTKKFNELGAEVTVQVAHGDLAVQIQQAKELIDAGVDALIVISVDSRESSKIIDMAKEKDVLVVAYDRPILDERTDLFFSFETIKAGRLQAQAALNAYPKGNYVLLNGPVSDDNAVKFRRGQLEVLQPEIDNGNIKIIADEVLPDWNEMSAIVRLHELNLDVSTIDCIISSTDVLTGGVMDYLEDDETKARIFVTGQDASKASIELIRAGHQNMTIFKSIKKLADLTAEKTVAYLATKSVDGLSTVKLDAYEFKGLLLEPVVIDQSNVDSNLELAEQLERVTQLNK